MLKKRGGGAVRHGELIDRTESFTRETVDSVRWQNRNLWTYLLHCECFMYTCTYTLHGSWNLNL